ncbi:MAG: ribosome recycling factor [Candidatus Hydrogenedentota bacterium]|jgi:ribosome recycling factor|uniref:Ribosome-recycling factor n=1 Tax=Sumerlaea chitinivorans TaxID=2250252 RepID=A0A2Z4Y8W5_SUMC1|nr:Ribosome recycling factor [Candidatus Sumerlaea chitinivorans]MCX7964819.1 ribosome recycling factor [Candidatus Sumerlaea chitinivorans]RMH27696.1 MAG: ribosome recycling factor [Candidatus Hydrogenedentota bacterium]GIX43853.1 MAG: ribosome-recycling factor [Candidatus Sumerlaea sp.]
MPLDAIYKEAKEKMHKAIEAVEHEFSTLRTGRASVALVDNIHVQAYGASMALKQLATISTPDSRTILITPFDRNMIGAIEKAIMAANIGLTPNNDGKAIRLTIPPLTEERRKELVKVARKMAEDGRVAVRNIRRHANEEIKKTEKMHEITEDDRKRAIDKVQEMTDKFIGEIDELLARKEKEIMEI